MYLSVALALTVLVLLFARDINRSAHGALGPRRSENRSFAQMVSGLVTQENLFDTRLAYLLVHGGSLSRPIFAARLDQLALELNDWSNQATLLRHPVLAHHVNDVVATLTQQRVDDYQNLLSSLAARLQLPWRRAPSGRLVVSDPGRSLLTTVQQWNVARWSLVAEPGRVALAALSDAAATYDVATGLAPLVGAASLAPTRAIAISAVEVTPAPLPAAPGTLLLPPVTSVQLGISVTNAAYINQPVTLVVVVRSSRGATQREVLHAVLGPLQSYAFASGSFATTADERATLSITVSGAAPAPGERTTRNYSLRLSPSGN